MGQAQVQLMEKSLDRWFVEPRAPRYQLKAWVRRSRAQLCRQSYLLLSPQYFLQRVYLGLVVIPVVVSLFGVLVLTPFADSQFVLPAVNLSPPLVANSLAAEAHLAAYRQD